MRVNVIPAVVLCASAALLTATGQTTSAPAASQPGAATTTAPQPTLLKAPEAVIRKPATTRGVEMMKWEVHFSGVTVALEHPAEWKQTKSTKNLPLLIFPGPEANSIQAGLEFVPIGGLGGRTINQLLEDRVQAWEKEGSKIVEKSVRTDARQATLLYRGTSQGIDMTGRQTILLIDDDHVLLTTEMAPSLAWEHFADELAKITASASVVVEAGH